MEVCRTASARCFYRRHYRPAHAALLDAMIRSAMRLRWVRDSLRLGLARDDRTRSRLAEDLAVWARRPEGRLTMPGRASEVAASEPAGLGTPGPPAAPRSREIAAVVVNYNTRELLRSCLESIRKERIPEVVVVDNASTDGSSAMVGSEFPEVRLIANRHNPGYGGGR